MLRILATSGALAVTAGLLATPAYATQDASTEGPTAISAETPRLKPVPLRAATAADPATRQAGEQGPPTVTSDDIHFTPGRTLGYGSAAEAGLVPEYVDRIAADAASFLEPSPAHPLYAGAVALAAKDGTIVTHEAVGHALRYSAYKDGEAIELPRYEWIAMQRNTIFDLASLTKVFTAIAVMQQVEAGRIDLDAPVARYIPEFAQNGKGDIVVRQLLTHTSGLPAWLPLYSNWDTPQERIAAVYAVEPKAPPETEYIYSDLGYITLGELVEKVTGKRLDTVIAETVTEPLGMTDTMFNPPDSLRERVAATEYQPWTGRGMLWGSVHDENSWSLGGVAGHAGLFSTAHDLSVFAQMLLNGGVYDGKRLLQPETVRAILTDYNSAFPGQEHGLGFSLAQRWFMDGLTTPVSFGHTGYTGTSLVVDPMSHSFAILLTNNVHPTREWPSSNPARRAVARDLARALPVRPAEGRDAWYSGTGDNRVATLTVPLDVPDDGARAKFDLWYDTEGGYDLGTFEVSSDGGKSWRAVPLDLRADGHRWSVDGAFSGFEGRQWLQAKAELPGEVTHIRWRYTTDALYQGRGVYVDGVRVWDAQDDLLFNGHRRADAKLFTPNGWHRSPN